MTPGERLKKIRNDSGLTIERAAELMGMSRGGYIKLERGERQIGQKIVTLVSRVFNVPSTALFSQVRTVPVVGYVSAGSAVIAYADGQGGLDTVIAPDYATMQTVAVEIKGESLGTVFNGWLAFYDERRDPPDESHVNRLCVVGLPDGRVMIKTVKRGQLYARWTLLSQFEPPVYDVEIGWAARVTGLQPKG